MANIEDHHWLIAVDTGGTFTDCVARDPAGAVHRAKVLSSSAIGATLMEILDERRIRLDLSGSFPEDFFVGFTLHDIAIVSFDAVNAVATLTSRISGGSQWRIGAPVTLQSPEEAPVLAARMVTRRRIDEPLPPLTFRLGTTRGTNALLERRGAPTAFFVTQGFGDLLRIGDQSRPDLFALNIVRPNPLYDAVVEVPERVLADGTIYQPLEMGALKDQIARLVESGIRSAAVVLMHSYVNAAHEQALARLILEQGFERVSMSSDLASFIRLLPRAQTTVVDAYLAPIIDEYLGRIRDRSGESPIFVMTSAGGLVRDRGFHAKDSLLSGPAGGVAGAAQAAKRAGFAKIIAFDMGGTSTDVSRFDGDFEYTFSHRVGDAELLAPALAIESVAAGGGSVCWFDGHRLRVGPQSGGASPGPACYGAGGPLTLTDVNLLLGRLDPARFGIPINPDHAREKHRELQTEIEHATGHPHEDETLLRGFIDIADERMAEAIRRISLRRGYDPTEYALVAFGGAGGMHACGVAERLGINTIILPPDAGILSALGIAESALERFAERQVLRDLDELGSTELQRLVHDLEDQACEMVRAEGGEKETIAVRRRLFNLRLPGQDSTLTVECENVNHLRSAWNDAYRAMYGYSPTDEGIEIESIRVVASTPSAGGFSNNGLNPTPSGSTARTARAIFQGEWCHVPVLDREKMSIDASISGPALVLDPHSAAVIEPGWQGVAHESGSLLLTRKETGDLATPAIDLAAEIGNPVDPIQLELFTSRFRAVAGDMGEILRRTARSTNVKERLDFSCAVLDPSGELVVNAPHIPVHLGALGICTRDVLHGMPLGVGDVVLTNHPAFGGSHLSDITLIGSAFDDEGELLGFVANRAHHAEIGGTRPGSMPPEATSLAEEGVLLPPMLLVQDGQPQWDVIRHALQSALHPSRSVDENISDLQGALASICSGVEGLRHLAQNHGRDIVHRYMNALKQHSEDRLRAALQRLTDGRYEAVEYLDDGSPLCVSVLVSGDNAVFDFAGSAPVHPGNLNATPAIVQSAVIYVLRLLVNEPMPLNEGLMNAVQVNIPTPSILDPGFTGDPGTMPAVAGGNVETSQRLVDTMLKALGLLSGGQGTMNNLLFGNEHFGYYETIGGGAGAGPGFDGASAVHTHMTNTRITDPELIEHCYPVRLDRFAIRTGSGGAGEHRGGEGVVREFTFLEPLALSLLTQHRCEKPYALAGGEPGAVGSQHLIRNDGTIQQLKGIDAVDIHPGDRLIIKTPGGAGFGERS